jgi:hypothetical protein
MMREDNLLCVRRRKFVVTTDSRHNLPTYPNLAAEIVPRATNQLWVAEHADLAPGANAFDSAHLQRLPLHLARRRL